MSMITIVSIATERSSMPARPVESLLPLTPLSYHVLLALVDGEMHGYAILRDIEERAAGAVRPGTGTLYAAIQRLVDEGALEESTARRASGDDARRRYYRLTTFGRSVARAETLRLARLLDAPSARALVPELRLTLPNVRP
jgi:DNA-binding PadR family transcriptional regulator